MSPTFFLSNWLIIICSFVPYPFGALVSTTCNQREAKALYKFPFACLDRSSAALRARAWRSQTPSGLAHTCLVVGQHYVQPNPKGLGFAKPMRKKGFGIDSVNAKHVRALAKPIAPRREVRAVAYCQGIGLASPKHSVQPSPGKNSKVATLPKGVGYSSLVARTR